MVSGNGKTVGQVRVFFVQDIQDYASIQIFNVVSHFRPAESNCDVCSYYEVPESQNANSVTSDSIFEKLQLVKLEDKLFLVPLVIVFEHDYFICMLCVLITISFIIFSQIVLNWKQGFSEFFFIAEVLLILVTFGRDWKHKQNLVFWEKRPLDAFWMQI